jgi:hypothetical protein
MFDAAIAANHDPAPAAPESDVMHDVSFGDNVGDAAQASTSSPCYEYGAKKGVRCLVCNHLYYDKSGFNKHLPRNVDCARAKSFRSVIPREGNAIESSSGNDNRGDEPFPVPVSSVAAALEVQVSHGQSRHLPQQFVDEDEDGPKKGVRCLICKTLFYDKSGYNKHLTRNVDCESARSFRIVHKRTFVDEAEAQAAKAAFRDADGVHD